LKERGKNRGHDFGVWNSVPLHSQTHDFCVNFIAHLGGDHCALCECLKRDAHDQWGWSSGEDFPLDSCADEKRFYCSLC
jgi:hypothetical protein